MLIRSLTTTDATLYQPLRLRAFGLLKSRLQRGHLRGHRGFAPQARLPQLHVRGILCLGRSWVYVGS